MQPGRWRIDRPNDRRNAIKILYDVYNIYVAHCTCGYLLYGFYVGSCEIAQASVAVARTLKIEMTCTRMYIIT